MKIKHFITVEQMSREELADLLSMLSGISYWGYLDFDEKAYDAAKEELSKPERKDEWMFPDELCYEEIIAEMLLSEEDVTIVDKEDDGKIHFVTLEDIYNAISRAIESGEISEDPDDWDGESADIIFQRACFGTVVYG